AGCLVRARQEPRAAAAGPVPADHHPVDRAGRAGDCRGAAAQRQGWLRARRRLAGQGRHRHRPRVRGDRNDHAGRRLGVRHQNGDDHLRYRRCRVLPVGGPKQAHQHRIGGIDEDSYTSVHYPGAVEDPDTGELISDAEVAETRYTLRLGRVRTLTVWRYHPFVTNSTLPTAEADITHRRHAIVETTFADLIDGPLAHIPSLSV